MIHSLEGVSFVGLGWVFSSWFKALTKRNTVIVLIGSIVVFTVLAFYLITPKHLPTSGPDSRWNRFAESIGGHWRIADAHCSSCIASSLAAPPLYRREYNRFLRHEWFVDDCGQRNAVYACSDALCCPFDHSADNCRSRSGRGGMLRMRNHHAYTQTLVLVGNRRNQTQKGCS
ncbi:hypothetical protein PG2006B_1476 [Bifidobacterium animalis subsp. animalis]|nr:hypothetical protein PG2006B_1476 [Bifidobacterium animalis subsp. animalis]